MIQLTINVSSVEAAIVLLDKLRAAPAPKAKPSVPTSPAVPSTPAVARTPAKPKRKYTRKNAAGGSPAGAAVAANPDAQAPAAPEPAAPEKAPAEGDKPQPSGVLPAPSAAPSEDEAKSAMEALYDAKGITVARDVLSRFGVKRVGELLPDARTDFIAKAKAVIGGEAA